MSVWTTKSLPRDADYIVMKHSIPGVNYRVSGVRFRAGYAVVEKGSKTYNSLKRMPQLANAPEYDLLYLKDLKFITRTSDIKMVYGADVYRRFLELLELSKTIEYKKEKENLEQVKQEEEIVHLAEESIKCHYRLSNGNLCKHDAEELSPSKYCIVHLLDDPKLADFGIKVPLVSPKHQKKALKKQVLTKIKKLMKEGDSGKVETAV
jgi:hypothetical protein